MPAKAKNTNKNNGKAPVQEPEIVTGDQGPQLDDSAAGDATWATENGLTTPLGTSKFMQTIEKYQETWVDKHVELEEGLEKLNHAVEAFIEDIGMAQKQVEKEHTGLRKMLKQVFGLKPNGKA